jgi:hypothetical protein
VRPLRKEQGRKDEGSYGNLLCVYSIDRHVCILNANSLGRRLLLPAQRGRGVNLGVRSKAGA